MEPGAILTTPAAHVRAAIDAAFLAAAATEGEAAAAGQILADSVEHVAAKLLPKGALTDAVLDLIIDLTDDKETIGVSCTFLLTPFCTLERSKFAVVSSDPAPRPGQEV